MKIKVLFLLLTGGFLTLAAWLVSGPNQGLADEVPDKYRGTVDKALDYLARNQHKDGHWEGEGGKHPVAMTGLVGIALLMDRTHSRGGKCSVNVYKAVDWLVAQCQPGRDGLIFSGHPSETARYMQGHGLATLFLADAFSLKWEASQQDKVKETVLGAVNYILKAQSTRGGWYHTSKAEGHDFDDYLATVIQVQALQAAQNARLCPHHEVVLDGVEYLRTSLEKYADEAKPAQNQNRVMETAAALTCRNGPFGRSMKEKETEKWFRYCQKTIPMGQAMQFGRDALPHYYYAQAAYLLGDKPGAERSDWTDYRNAMFDHLQSTQNKDGSWPAATGISDGPVYATALWCTVMQLDRNVHPTAHHIRPMK